jgi:hypothetical protein
VTLVTGPGLIFFARLQDHFGQRDRSASGKTGQFSHGYLATDVCRTQTLSGGIAVAAVAQPPKKSPGCDALAVCSGNR